MFFASAPTARTWDRTSIDERRSERVDELITWIKLNLMLGCVNLGLLN